MSQDPRSDAQAYNLSRNVVADMEAEEGPPLGAHTGQTKTNPRGPGAAARQGPKTIHALRAQINRRSRG